MAQTLFMSLKAQNPDCEIAVLAPDWTRPLLERMPEVQKAIAADLGHGELKLGRRYQLGKELANEGYAKAFVLPNSFKSALVPYFANIPVRVGWRGEWRYIVLNDCRALDKKALPQMVQRFAALAFDAKQGIPDDGLPRPKLVSQAVDVEAVVTEFDLDGEGEILAICPGAEFGAAKQWPVEYYAELAAVQIQAGRQVWIFGSEKDRAIADSIEKSVNSKRCRNLAGKTSLAQAIDLMSLVTTVVSNDSGLMHIAAALEKPVAGIYGSTSPDFTPPLAERVKLLSTEIECRPCFQRDCPLGHLRCLTELEPKRVADAVEELIDSSSQRAPE